MDNPHRTVSIHIIIRLLVLVVLVPLLPLLISWRWDWWEAWAYAILFILGFARPLHAPRERQTPG